MVHRMCVTKYLKERTFFLFNVRELSFISRVRTENIFLQK